MGATSNALQWKLFGYGGEISVVKCDVKIKNGAKCKVIAGVHAGKTGVVQDLRASKTGHLTLTVLQRDGERFKTLAKNVTAGQT